MADENTCGTLIRAAAAGTRKSRAEFARRYLDVVKAYLAARWRGRSLASEADDGVQEVFVECFRKDGVLDKANPSRAGGFRALFYGVVRNVAMRIERRRVRLDRRRETGSFHPDEIDGDEERLSLVFDRAWARSILKEAGARMRADAAREGGAALRRVEILEARFQDNVPIREMAERFQVDASVLHHEYARARNEFHAALGAVVAEELSVAGGEAVERECRRVIELLR
jgi:RNA polymerase sigma-70 factor (ECF subfamily)